MGWKQRLGQKLKAGAGAAARGALSLGKKVAKGAMYTGIAILGAKAAWDYYGDDITDAAKRRVQQDLIDPAKEELTARGEALMELSKCFGTTGSVVGTGQLNRQNYAPQTGVVATARPAAGTSINFCPLGLDLEAFQLTAIESGVNTAERSAPITLILNLGTALAEALNIDAYVSFDSLYYIDSSGVISVSH